MHLVGVDLAWGLNRPTGLAVLDDSGRLVHVSAARTDDDIAAVLAPWTAGDCVVAVDAPLVVTTPTGNRPAEAALNRDFAGFDAGAHPTNLGKPEMREGPRGGRLCERLGLEVACDPGAGTADGRRVAIEVYPHAATVALFRLGRTLKYKHKPGRSFDQLRDALLVLVRLLEGLAAADPALDLDVPAWHDLVARVEHAERKSELRAVEDQVDAVVCAYVALLAARRPDVLTSYGDAETGCIVTPALPADHRPTPRERVPAAPDDTVRHAVAAYTELHPQLVVAADQAVALMTRILDEAGINYLTVTGRAKSVASFAAKAARVDDDGRPVYADPLADITDQVGVRVITYVQRDVEAVADLLRANVVVHDDRDWGRETASEGRFGYASRHLLVGLDPSRERRPELALLRGRVAQVQLRTVLQHAWAEFEHDVRYKGTIPDEHVPDLDRRFTLAAGLLELADQEFSAIRDRLQQGMSGHLPETEDDDPRISPRELAAFLAGQYADAGWSRTDHYAWISGLLLELGIASLDELAGTLAEVDSEALNERMDYRYPPGAVRRLDDALLAVFGDRYVDLHGNSHRRPLLQTRLARMRG